MSENAQTPEEQKKIQEGKNGCCALIFVVIVLAFIAWLAWPNDNDRYVDGAVITTIEGHDYIKSPDGSKTHSASCPCHALRGGE